MIIGTAGHIDHGKTALLKALTGQSGDRTPMERKRGITIDLGYAYVDLGDGSTTGFIDVPGHERFVHNMLAGASGIDAVLLVIAADDGIMPQTREHLAIVEMLGISHAIVALTKIDRVDEDRIRQLEDDIAAFLESGPFAGSPIFPVSSLRGDGIDALRQALARLAETIHRRSDDGLFRLSVDRAFNLTGTGIVVTGTAFSGRVATGEELLIGTAGMAVRVRGMHAQNRQVNEAFAGQRVAVNITGERLKLEDLRRGDWLLAEPLFAPTTRLDISLNLLPQETKALRHWTPVHVHLGAQDVTGRVALLEAESLSPGRSMLAQLVLNAPVQAIRGDHLVLRDQSARRTLGGGRVLDNQPPSRHRRSPERLKQLCALAHGSVEDAVSVMLAQAINGIEPKRLTRLFNLLPDRFLSDDVLEVATKTGPRLFSKDNWQLLGDQLQQGLQRFHLEAPDEPGPDRDRLRRYALPQLERSVFIAVVESALAQKRIQSSGAWLHLPSHQVVLSDADEQLWQSIRPLLTSAGFDPPWVRNLARTMEKDEQVIRLLLRKLAQMGRVHQIVRDLFYCDETVQQLAHVLWQTYHETGVISVTGFRDRLGIGRKRSIQILEFFDRAGLTRRLGEERRFRTEAALYQQLLGNDAAGHEGFFQQ